MRNNILAPNLARPIQAAPNSLLILLVNPHSQITRSKESPETTDKAIRLPK